MSTRKRTRESILSDNDIDELTPSKKSREGNDIQSNKKRKLNLNGLPPSSNAGTPAYRLLGFVDKVTRWAGKGKGQGNGQLYEEAGNETEIDEEDELSASATNDKNNADIWDVPDDEETPKKHPSRLSRVSSGLEKKMKLGAGKDDSDYDNGSLHNAIAYHTTEGRGKGYEKTTPAARGLKTTTTASFQNPSPANQSRSDSNIDDRRKNETPKRGRPRKDIKSTNGNTNSGENVAGGARRHPEGKIRSSRGPRKSDILKKDKAHSREDIRARLSLGETNEQDDADPDVGVPARRKSGRRSKSEADVTEIADSEDGRDNEEVEVQNPLSREKGSSRALQAVPKGILTPTKPRTVKSRKSVAFERHEGLDLGFKDLPISTEKEEPRGNISTLVQEPNTETIAGNGPGNSTKHPKKSLKYEEIEVEAPSEDSADEIACAVCKGLKSRKPNAIILCDNCDFAVHQKCYGVVAIPKGDWYCKECQTRQQSLDAPDMDEVLAHEIQVIENFGTHLQSVQRLVLDRLTGQRQMKLHGHTDERQKVFQVVEQTVLAGEGNSMLVVGARGCGKTTLVESVINELTDHRESYHVVRLNGFIHTDDKLALREIWRQLGREMEIGEEGKINAADTLASLLALLSHPSEISGDQSGETAKSVIFILDEFDLFTTHSRQTLLYNLFDIAQARKAPIVVIGLTTRIDVVEALEKRVKSRFSHRYVYLNLPRSLGAFWEVCRDGLLVTKDELKQVGVSVDAKGLDDFLAFWQTSIDQLYGKDETFKHHLQSHFYRTKSVSGFLTSCILPVANLSVNKYSLSGKAFVDDNLSFTPPDSKLHILQGLSELELALLIAAARLDIILDTDTCNFAMAYDEYSSLTSRHRIQTSSSGMAALGSGAKMWGREVALGAWERIAEYNLLVPATLGGNSSRDFGAGGRMWKLDVGLEEITASVNGLSTVMTKWCREI